MSSVWAAAEARATSRTFFPAKGRGLADFNLLNAGLAKAPFNVLLIPTIGKTLLIPVISTALRSFTKSRGKKILLIPVLIPGLARIRPGD